MEVLTDRLRLVAADVALSAAQVAGPEALAQALGVSLPEDWPPEHNDDEHARWFHGKLAANPDQVGWWSWYVLLRRDEALDLAVAIAGFKGPAENGAVEVGYSVAASRHRQGIATEAVSGLIGWAFSHAEIKRVEAETYPHLTPSIGVLTKLGFEPMSSENPDTIRFVRLDR
jgi:ribosomal-protein-alanine N-acetyltransferase